MVDIDGHEGAGARHLLRRLRRPAGAVARRHAAGVDVEPRRRPRGADLPRAVESREARSTALASAPPRKRAQKSHDHVQRQLCAPRCRLRGSHRRRPPAHGARRRRADGRRSRRRARTSRRSRRERLEGRLAGSTGRAAGGRLPRRASCSASARSRCRASTDYPRRRSSSPPARSDGGSTVTVARRRRGLASVQRAERDVQALSFSDNGEVSGPVVFAGYGIVVPEVQNFGYDSYADARREGQDRRRPPLLPRGRRPEDARRSSRATPTCATRRMAARQRGAKALLVVTGPRSPNAGETVPMTFDTALAGSGIVAASISGDVAAAMFAARGQDARGRAEGARQRQSARRRLRAAGRHASRVNAAVVRETADRAATSSPTCRRRRRRPASPKPWVALGAHYDHLGRGDARQLARRQGRGRRRSIYGADDNASGTAAVLAIADALAKQPRQRNVLLGFWSGEELGLIGSNAFVTTPPVPLDQIAAYLNFDMVGRMQDNKLTVQATGTSPVWAQHARAGERRGRLRPARCRRIRISRPTSRASTRRACRA